MGDLVKRWWDELERLGRILGQIGPDEVCCEGLSQRQCAILRTLVAQEGARISDLAASSGITPSAMTRVLERLEARKLVERVRGAQADGRAAMVRITGVPLLGRLKSTTLMSSGWASMTKLKQLKPLRPPVWPSPYLFLARSTPLSGQKES